MREDMRNKKKKCELLVPAGGPDQYIAAVENGADAVYLGGKNFNARMNAGNFDLKELEAAVDYGHLRNVKTYVTMNTLVADDEMAEAAAYAARLCRMGVDALIIQDLGLGHVIRQNFPDMELHLSTQGSVYDREGVLAAARLGYSRVVLARELSLAEIRRACSQQQVEIEVFVHGAMCMCYSGQCQLSRFIGGRSGNRGGCAQPCRLPYQYLHPDGKKMNTPACPLSPKDLCLVDELGALADCGVASLKIEGRMKSPEYVAVVTSIYRRYLDMYFRQGSYTVTEEDRRDLAQIFNRGGFTTGYFYGDPGENLMCGGLPKHQGVPVGKVRRLTGQGSRSGRPGPSGQAAGGRNAGQKGGYLIDVEPFYDRDIPPLRLGDGVEIHSRRLTGNVITFLQQQKNGLLRIGDLKDPVKPGDMVYRITSRQLMESAEQTFKNLTFEEGKYQRKLPIKAVFLADAGSPAQLRILEPVSLTVTDDQIIGQVPLKRPTTEEEIRRQLEKTGGTPFAFQELKIELKAPVSIPLSGLNALRRKALAELAEKIKAAAKRSGQKDIKLPALEMPGGKPELQYYFYDWRDLERTTFDKDCGRDVTALVEVLDFAEHRERILEIEEREGILICPYIPAIGKGGDSQIEAQMDQLEALLQISGPDGRQRRIHVGNLRWILPFADRGAVVAGEPGMNLYNRWAMDTVKSLGVIRAETPLENEEGAQGWLPLMITEHAMTPGRLIDRKGAQFRVLFLEKYHKTCILGWKDTAFKSEKDSEENRALDTIRIHV